MDNGKDAAIAILDLFANRIARSLGEGANSTSDDAKAFNAEYATLRSQLQGEPETSPEEVVELSDTDVA